MKLVLGRDFPSSPPQGVLCIFSSVYAAHKERYRPLKLGTLHFYKCMLLNVGPVLLVIKRTSSGTS